LNRQVRGSLKVIGESSGERRQLSIILSAEREGAVASVVAAEISGAREIEAIKALAVVVRTFMLSHAGRHKAQGFDFCDTTHCQLYRGETDLSAELLTPLVANAVALSKGEFLSFNSRGIEGHYTAACGGATLAPEVVWGGQVASGYPYKSVSCGWCRGSSHYRWTRRAPAQAVMAAIALGAQRASSDAEILVESDEPGAVARSVVIRDRHNSFRLTPDEFRRRVGQRLGWNRVLSPTFSVERRGNSFIFRGRGFGSQIGLCVAGALAQAKAGRTRDAILSFYYPQAAVERDL
jgi:stage II sporulation protein D